MSAMDRGTVSVRRITGDDGHYFYGYYDNAAWHASDKLHLCHRVQFWDRLPGPDDRAELGILDLQGGFRTVAETMAWNFQQGSMLQWHPGSPEDEIIYNTRENGRFAGVRLNIRTGARQLLDRPVANVDAAGKYALSISFERMFDFRPGYGYAGIKDPNFDSNHPADDGVHLVDLATGASKLILSLDDIWRIIENYFHGQDRKILINHITFNTDGSRFLCLVRYFPREGENWQTALITANTDGSDPYLLADFGYASHYHWRDRDHILIHSSGQPTSLEGHQLYLLKDKTREVATVDTQFFLFDGHCSYSPDRQQILYDSYPGKDRMRQLLVYDLESRKGIRLGNFYSYPTAAGDIRCDLHPRWNRSGSAISFDSSHEGHRSVYVID
ncbi:hypothetical protein [Paenibacillus koleovorans]|uniref:hypothetical protein n=1 Tax=Paenibacillus koleovorans TaxID=121608 RepID=UPI000FDAE219|nr:hypothetical protein [Paenibacillus koleovorans]